MAELTDVQVWRALDSYEREIRRWRMGPWHSGQVLAIADRAELPLVPWTDGAPVNQAVPAPEKLTFRDEETAERYIRWRAIKAALTTAYPSNQSSNNKA